MTLDVKQTAFALCMDKWLLFQHDIILKMYFKISKLDTICGVVPVQ